MTDTTRPSEVFIRRMRDVRHERGYSQARLAAAMTAGGRPLSKAALLRIENGERGLSLDEALALAMTLWIAPAHLLTPLEGERVALTDKVAVGDGSAMRNFLRFGHPHPPEHSQRASLSAKLERTVLDYAQALVDASRGNDRAGVNEALVALGRAALDHRDALEADNG